MKNHCEECKVECYGEVCEKCCEHQDICYDERGCLICGKDMTEELMARAYDLAKDRKKYGDD